MWKYALEKTEEMGKGRGLVADMLQNRISEMVKEMKRKKEQQFKKYFEVSQRMITEVLDTIKELTTVSDQIHVPTVCVLPCTHVHVHVCVYMYMYA